MGSSQSRKLVAYLPLVFVATFAVVVAPTLFVLWLRESGAVASTWVALAIGVVLSLAASQAGAAVWKAKANSDLLFNDLMLWGWMQRFRGERRLAAATDLLGLSVGRPKAITGGQLSSGEKKQLLTQLTSGLEASDPYTHGHSRRVARHAANIAKHMGLSGAEVAKIRAAGAMHDVGKVETPTAVLHKAGRLTDEEFAIVKRHPVAGADMVATLDDDELTAIVRHHHERLDGTGYPDGLAGDEIPLGARILAVADTFDAITSTRPYRQANPHKKALDILQTEAGTQLDPDAVKAFLECYSGMKPVAFWAVLINARPRVSASLGQVFSPVTGTNVMATTVAAAAVGAVAVGPGAHTVPASSQTSAPEAALSAPTSPFSANSGPKTTVLASLLADPDARTSGDRAARSSDKANERGRGPGGSDPVPSGRPESSAKRNNAPGRGAQPQDGTPGSPVGGDDDTSAPANNGDKAPGSGNAHELPEGTKPAKGKGKGNGNGNAYGHSKGNRGNGNGKAYRPSPDNGPNPGGGQGKGQGEVNGNANGLDKVKDKVKEKVTSLVPAPDPDGVARPKR